MVLQFVNVAIAATIGAASSVQVPVSHDWIPFSRVDGNTIYVDGSNLYGRKTTEKGLEFVGIIKLDMAKPIAVPGTKKVGKYYLNKIHAYCKTDTAVIEESQLVSAADEVLADAKNLATIKNPHVKGSFVSDFMGALCNNPKSDEPEINV